MIITNQKLAVNLKIQKPIALLTLIVVMGLIYFTNILSYNTLGFGRDQIAIFIIIIFMVYFLFNYLRNHNYIYYSDTGNKFIIRYYSLRPLQDKKNLIEFNKSEFHDYEIRQSPFRFSESIIIYRKTPKGIAKYPPLSITALGRSNKEKLLASFQKLIRANQMHQ